MDGRTFRFKLKDKGKVTKAAYELKLLMDSLKPESLTVCESQVFCADDLARELDDLGVSYERE